jgi:hypothetical protein
MAKKLKKLGFECAATAAKLELWHLFTVLLVTHYMVALNICIMNPLASLLRIYSIRTHADQL